MATRCGITPCPELPLAGSVAGHPCRSCPWSAHSSRGVLRAQGLCLACLCPLASTSMPLPSGQREHVAEQFARQPSLPAPLPSPRSLAQPCPLCARPPSSSLAPLLGLLGLWPSVSLSPSSLYPPRRTLCRAICEASLPLPLHLSAPWCPGLLACGTHVALHPPAAFFPLCPPCLPLPPLPFSPSDTMQDTV